jgi:hypothetical protein
MLIAVPAADATGMIQFMGVPAAADLRGALPLRCTYAV